MAPLTRNRLILAKAETTYGTSAAPAGADAIRVMNDLQLNPLQMELVNRELLYGWIGNVPRAVVQRLAQISFSFELAGSGTAGTAPKTGVFFRAAGYSQTIVASTSVTYAPIGTGFEGITINCRHGGKQHLLTGVRGGLSLELTTNQIAMGKFDGIGIFNAITDQTDPTPTYDLQTDGLVVNSDNTPTVSVGGFSACFESFTFNSGRSPVFRQLAGCTKRIRIDQDRRPEGEITIESPTIAAKNFFADASAQTATAITWTHGTTAGNIVQFNAPTCSLGDPSYSDSDGFEMLGLPFMPIPGLTNGYNDHSIVFT
jgi:hypothetical protein